MAMPRVHARHSLLCFNELDQRLTAMCCAKGPNKISLSTFQLSICVPSPTLIPAERGALFNTVFTLCGQASLARSFRNHYLARCGIVTAVIYDVPIFVDQFKFYAVFAADEAA